MRCAIVLAPMLALSACDVYAQGCTLEMRHAVEVDVVDASGDPRPVDAVTWSYVDTGSEGLCTGTSTRWLCGVAEAGELVVRALEGDTVVAEEVVRVRNDLDGCPETEHLEIVL